MTDRHRALEIVSTQQGRRAAREAHSLLTSSDLPLEARLKIGAALEALQDMLALGNTPESRHAVLNTWQAKLATIAESMSARAARGN